VGVRFSHPLLLSVRNLVIQGFRRFFIAASELV
jgi:hypothetical protein